MDPNVVVQDVLATMQATLILFETFTNFILRKVKKLVQAMVDTITGHT